MKTCCIYHSRDLDGWMSAAIVKDWYNKELEQYPTRYPSHREFTAHIADDIDFIGWDYGNPIPDLTQYGKVIMVDISFPKEHMEVLFTTLQDNFIWCDHHISAIKDSQNLYYQSAKGKRVTLFAACELTWRYFFPNDVMPEIVRLLGRYDCFGHKGTDEELKVLEFQYGARQVISNYEDAYNYLHNCLLQVKEGSLENSIWLNGKAIYSYLCTEAKGIYKRAFPITFVEYPMDIVNDSTRKFLCVNQDRFNPINFGIDYHKDGYDGFACFWYANGKFNYSLYNDNGKVDCSIIAKNFGGGGHKGASGFITNHIIL